MPEMLSVSISSNTIEELNYGRVCSHAQSEPMPDPSGRIVARGRNPATGKTKTEIAALLGISRQHLYDILEERKPVSPPVAVRLGKLFGDGAGAWVRMQSAYDTWNAERELANEIKKIPTLKPAAA
jgi:antitoxin HigA-1